MFQAKPTSSGALVKRDIRRRTLFSQVRRNLT
jgi:hypothetical protein